jgi:hypothetical protein
MTISRVSVIVTAVTTIICCLIGLLYNYNTIAIIRTGAFERLPQEPHFYPAFYTMSAICIVFNLVLICFSMDFLRGFFRCLKSFTIVMVFKVINFFAIGAFWLHPTLGRSVASATGVANGGLMAQFLILLPLWAPLVLFIAQRGTQGNADN